MPGLDVRTDRSSPSPSDGGGIPDANLIQRVAAGNRLAMQVLYLRHRLRLHRYIVRIVGDKAMAEDLLSDTFLDVWRKAGSFRGSSTVATWLLAIARYKAISAVRQGSHERLDDERAAVSPDESDDPETRLQKIHQAGILHRSLAQLSTKHREIISLIYYQEKSPEEVAMILRTPRNTVKTRMFYARKHLAELLTAAGVTRAVP